MEKYVTVFPWNKQIIFTLQVVKTWINLDTNQGAFKRKHFNNIEI